MLNLLVDHWLGLENRSLEVATDWSGGEEVACRPLCSLDITFSAWFRWVLDILLVTCSNRETQRHLSDNYTKLLGVYASSNVRLKAKSLVKTIQSALSVRQNVFEG